MAIHEGKKVLVVVPSDQNDDCSLLFIAPNGMSATDANMHASAAVEKATDDAGEYSGEVIDYLDNLGFDCLGNPSIAVIPLGVAEVTVTAPMYIERG